MRELKNSRSIEAPREHDMGSSEDLFILLLIVCIVFPLHLLFCMPSIRMIPKHLTLDMH